MNFPFPLNTCILDIVRFRFLEMERPHFRVLVFVHFHFVLELILKIYLIRGALTSMVLIWGTNFTFYLFCISKLYSIFQSFIIIFILNMIFLDYLVAMSS